MTYFGNGADNNSMLPPQFPTKQKILKVILEEEETSLVSDIYGSAE